MVAAYVTDLRRAVSAPRLDGYRPPGGSDLDMAVTYFWNITLCEALYPSLALLEISLRNAIHDALTIAHKTDLWFYESGLLEPQQLREFANARSSLYKVHGNQPTAGRIVAELNFGFWVTLLSRNYNGVLWNPNHAALLRAVFPHLTGPLFRRDRIHQRYNDLRLLRNRVFHHEPVWRTPLRSRPNINLAELHTEMMAAIAWIDPTLRNSAAALDRFSDVNLNGRSTIETSIKRQIGIP